jgi:hypothetical protein
LYIDFLNSLLSNIANDYYILSKLGQLYYLQRDYDLSFQALISASKFACLRSSSLILLVESSLFLSDSSQISALSMLISENRQSPRFEYFHHICLFSILIQRVDVSLSTFISDFSNYLSSWQTIHWFNRLPFSIDQDSSIMSSLDNYFSLNSSSLDWRWHYHYSISLMLYSRISDSLFVLESYQSCRSEVTELQSSLLALGRHLSTNIPSTLTPIDWQSEFNPFFIDSFSDVIVVFSGWTGAFGYLSDFSISTYFHQLGLNVLILRDPLLKFFSDGIAPSRFSSNYLSDLFEYLDSHTSGSIIFCGDSISALAAIHHSCLFPSKVTVIAFSPVLSKSDYSTLGLTSFDNKAHATSDEHFSFNTRGHQSLIRIEATRNLYPNIFNLLASSTNVDLHVAYAALNRTDSLAANYFYQSADATLHCLRSSSVHVVSNEFISGDHFPILLERLKLAPSISLHYQY